MKLSRLLLFCLQVAVWAVLAAAAAGVPAAAPSPGCATMARCGDIDVPYPFALEPQCAISGFYLNCTTAVGGTGNPKLFVGHDNLEVMKISVQHNKVWVKTYISRQCFDNSMNTIYNDTSVNITGTPYVLSAEDNKVIVLGCRTLAYMLSDGVSNIHIP